MEDHSYKPQALSADKIWTELFQLFTATFFQLQLNFHTKYIHLW